MNAARITPGLIAAPATVALDPDELVVAVPPGVGHVRDVVSEGIGVLLCFEAGRRVPARLVRASSAQGRILFRGRVGWHEGQVGQ